MTVEEPLDRIEHWAAALAEERSKDREEYKALWRDAQQQLTRLAVAVKGLAGRVDSLASKVVRIATDQDRLILEGAARDQATNARIDRLVSAIGEFIAAQQPKRPEPKP